MNKGDVETPCGTLRCTLRAAIAVNGRFGDYAEAFNRLQRFDFAAYVAIVAAGLGKDPKEVEARVFEAGMSDLCGPLSAYVGFLSRGGKPLPTGDEDQNTGEG